MSPIVWVGLLVAVYLVGVFLTTAAIDVMTGYFDPASDVLYALTWPVFWPVLGVARFVGLFMRLGERLGQAIRARRLASAKKENHHASR